MGRRDDDDRSEKDDPWGNRLPRSQWDDRRISTSQTPVQKKPEFTPSKENLRIMASGELGAITIIPNEDLADRLKSLYRSVISGEARLSPLLAGIFEENFKNVVDYTAPLKPFDGDNRTYVTQEEVSNGYLRKVAQQKILNNGKSLDSYLNDSEE